MFKYLKWGEIKYLKSWLFALALVLSPSLAQAQRADANFVLYQSKSMSSDAFVLSLKQPTSGGRLVALKAAVLQCPSATSFTIEINCGTPATSTSTAPTPVGYPRLTPNVLGYINSNAASCTTIAFQGTAAGFPATMDLTGIWLTAAGQDVTMRSATVTSGTCVGWLVGREY